MSALILACVVGTVSVNAQPAETTVTIDAGRPETVTATKVPGPVALTEPIALPPHSITVLQTVR